VIHKDFETEANLGERYSFAVGQFEKLSHQSAGKEQWDNLKNLSLPAILRVRRFLYSP
jgi:hypothetical protein